MRHISPLPAASTGPLPSTCHEACTAIPRPILAATGARDLESTENLGGPLVQYIDLLPSRVDILALVFQRQVPTIQTVQKTVEVLETQHFDGVADVPVVLQRPVPTIQSVQKTMEVPETQCLEWQFNTKYQPSRQYRRRWRFQRLSVLIEWHV